ncbi:hypothetical protein, variant [Exophiala xenobiotica]|uniref:Uncharacterized protein n=1 Tax=Exophiala xenobiotica TaxID=348802 RepID=A0A0D2E5S6_9EURO|nr:hypothetical protein, variant [Exophiala xenobiotica]KIW50055.1 hypothetical protein, variant [Exophiala xenobiotica]
MTVRKQYPPRNYETFPEEGASESQRSSSSDKSRTAAAEAQRLGSLGSWADNFAGETPATNRTPTASTVDGDEVRNVQYPQLSQELDPSDPPPVYTPSDTTQSRPPTEPASPVVQRSVPVQPETDDRKQFPNFGPQPSASPWPPFPKREHREHETFRSISGTYQLYDLLDLSTTSGSISVNIEVQSGEKPAVLRLSSTAGSVHVKMTSGGGLFRKATVPEIASKRTLITEISAHAGSVAGDLVHGNGGSTTVTTHAGSVSLTLYTSGVSDEDPVSNISTSTWQGSQNIKVLAPFTPTEAVRAILGSHVVRGSGSMNIQYPQEWEGMVHIKAMGMGSIGASGQGLNVQKESSRELYGYRGMKEGRRIEVLEGGSGSVQFRC